MYPEDPWADYGESAMVLMADCVRCGILFASDPEAVPSVWINTETRCPVRPDGTAIKPGEPGTKREPLCGTCAPIINRAVNKPTPVATLFPRARVDRIHKGKEG